ncbi:hypothetical protein [Marinobacterium marinum]|uniref:Uncharacterized protein n=1 Tax=Marinobacterium marinum TaxID=2756129 RepID=A0A7W1WWV4_9GAMM|nr:hypothetical protein [Marinobacterium marinum]MBA4501700.1 hypothetical protein [Marinobacterium marinum]
MIQDDRKDKKSRDPLKVFIGLIFILISTVIASWLVDAFLMLWESPDELVLVEKMSSFMAYQVPIEMAADNSQLFSGILYGSGVFLSIVILTGVGYFFQFFITVALRLMFPDFMPPFREFNRELEALKRQIGFNKHENGKD